MSKILLVSHYTLVPGVYDKIANYLKKKGHIQYSILYPLFPRSFLPSLIKTPEKSINFKIYWPIQYILESFISLWFFKKNTRKAGNFDLAICFDPLSFLNIYIFKKLYKVKKIIYYNVDFSTRRFKNIFLNFIYQKINYFAYVKCYYFFYQVESFVEVIDPKRIFEEKNFLLKHTSGTNEDTKKIPKILRSLIFVGVLSYNVNFDPLINALERLYKNGIDFIFDIYGEGEQLIMLTKRIRQLDMTSKVNFKGVVDNDTLITKIMPQYLIGVAPYITKDEGLDSDHMFKCTDLPTKIVEYISCGLTVITTALSSAFSVIEKEQFGFLVKDEEDWYNALYVLLTQEVKRGEYSKNAFVYSRKYTEAVVLDPVFNKILSDN